MLIMNRITLVALDIAGTTVEEGGAVYRVLAEVVSTHRRPSDAEIKNWMGADKRQAIAARTGLDRADPAVEALHEQFVATLAQAYAATPPVPIPGTPEAFAALRAAGIRVVLTTGFDRQVTDPLLTSLGWSVPEVLDGVVCASEVAAGRPAPDMINRAMELVGIDDPRQVLAAGDTVLDVRAGHAAGAGVVIGVLSGAQTTADLTPEHPTRLLDSVADLPALLLEQHPDEGGASRR